MAEYHETTYGERIAEVYDLFYGSRDNPESVEDFLEPLAGKRRALELGIGTGRIAIPLAARGVRVMGIDASPAMVAKMRAKTGRRGHPGRNRKLRRREGFPAASVLSTSRSALEWSGLNTSTTNAPAGRMRFAGPECHGG